MEAKKKRGRPAGSKNKPRDEVEVFISSCRVCGSTDRSKYTHTTTMELEGVLATGQRYNQVTWRHTSCLHCGQSRIDRFYEMAKTVKAEPLPKQESEESLADDDESNVNDIFDGCIDSDQIDDLIHGESNGNSSEDSEAAGDP